MRLSLCLASNAKIVEKLSVLIIFVLPVATIKDARCLATLPMKSRPSVFLSSKENLEDDNPFSC